MPDPCNISDDVIQTAGNLVEMSSTFKFFVQSMPKFLVHYDCCMILLPIFRLKLPAVSKFFLVPSTKNSGLVIIQF